MLVVVSLIVVDTSSSCSTGWVGEAMTVVEVVRPRKNTFENLIVL